MENKVEWKATNLPGVLASADGAILQDGKPQKLTVNKHGYLVFRHRTSGTVEYAHRAVASAFVPGYSSQPTVNHIDGVKTNNNAANLECVSHADNIRHAWSTGLCKRQFSAVDVGLIIDAYKGGESMTSIGGRLGVSRTTIRRILSRESYSCVPGSPEKTGVRSGSRHWNSSVCDRTRARIKFMRDVGMLMVDISSITGATYSTVTQICRVQG